MPATGTEGTTARVAAKAFGYFLVFSTLALIIGLVVANVIQPGSGLNIDLSLQDQVLLLLVAMLSSKGAAGITGAGFITLAATLAVVPTVPIAGMALILGIDRFMSECRALTNFVGNAVATLVVARWEGELDREALHAALGSRPGRLAAPPDPAAGPGDRDVITAD